MICPMSQPDRNDGCDNVPPFTHQSILRRFGLTAVIFQDPSPTFSQTQLFGCKQHSDINETYTSPATRTISAPESTVPPSPPSVSKVSFQRVQSNQGQMFSTFYVHHHQLETFSCTNNFNLSEAAFEFLRFYPEAGTRQ